MPRILLTNDDGIDAPGIRALHGALAGLGEIRTIAPLTVQSATSHAVTFHEPLLIREVSVSESMSGIAVAGRPADCVKLAVTSLWAERFGGRPDLVISGMNAGANVGIHVIYSGTVAAAIEGALLGIPAIAVSLYVRDWKRTRFDIAAQHARYAIDQCLALGPLDPHTVLNINLPVCESDENCPAGESSDPAPAAPPPPPPPIRVVPMNLAAIRDTYERRINPSGTVYYWVDGDGLSFQRTTPGSDVEALFKGFITVSPLQYDLTDHTRLEHWKSRLEGGCAGRRHPSPDTAHALTDQPRPLT